MITPIEIRQHTFKKALRGYDKDDVHAYLNTLSLEWEKMVEDLRRLKTELDKTQSNLDNLKQVESALHKTLMQAEESSKSMIENAKKDAELKVQEAEARSQGLIKKAFDERSKMEMQVNELVARRNEIMQQLKSFLSAQSERLALFEQREMKAATPPPAAQPKEEESKSFFESAMVNGQEGSSSVVSRIVDEL